MFIERKFASDHKLVLSCYIESLALLKCALYLEKNLPAFRPTPDIQLLHCTMYTVQYSCPDRECSVEQFVAAFSRIAAPAI